MTLSAVLAIFAGQCIGVGSVILGIVGAEKTLAHPEVAPHVRDLEKIN